MPNQKYTPLRDEEDIGEDAQHSKLNTTGWIDSLNIPNLVVNVAVFTIGLVVGSFLSNALRWSSDHRFEQYSIVPSPAFEAIASKPLIRTPHNLHDNGHKSEYQGYPTPETTSRWMDLMNGYSIRVSSKYMDALDLESIPLNDNSGDVWVSMNVYHHLHCLDSIRHQIAGEQCSDPHDAAANLTGNYDLDNEHYFPPHIDHCIETLRKRLICQPDLGVRAIAWNPDKPGVAFANNTVNSACVNWDAVQDWTRKHSFTEDEKLISTPDGHTYIGPRTPPARCGQ